MKIINKIVRWTAIIAVVVGVAGGIGFLVFKAGGHYQPKLVEVPVDHSAEQYDAKIEGLKDSVVAELKACESAGHNEDYGLVTYDPAKGETNPERIPSFGTLQFKKKTVVYYYKLLQGKDITGKEAILIALDDKRAGELAKRVMFETKGMASSDWYNCAVKYSLDAKIAIIKKLEVK